MKIINTNLKQFNEMIEEAVSELNQFERLLTTGSAGNEQSAYTILAERIKQFLSEGVEPTAHSVKNKYFTTKLKKEAIDAGDSWVRYKNGGSEPVVSVNPGEATYTMIPLLEGCFLDDRPNVMLMPNSFEMEIGVEDSKMDHLIDGERGYAQGKPYPVEFNVWAEEEFGVAFEELNISQDEYLETLFANEIYNSTDKIFGK